ncbi:MAG: glyoxylate/hydroxypyruvate reductase A [Cyanobacteria bacterium P01_D01_bin.156]
MSVKIPFIGRINANERNRWITALTQAAPADLDICVAPLAECSEEEKHIVEVAIVANPDPAELEQLPNLKWVQSLWAGVETLLKSVPDTLQIVRMTDPQLAETMAEAVLAWVLYLHRDMPTYRQQQAQHIWAQHCVPLPQDRTVGILGLGKLGIKAASRLIDNGFTVYGWSRSGGNCLGINSCSGVNGLRHVLQSSHIVVILLPLTHETHGLLDANAFNNMPEGASLINFARGPIVDDTALLNALNAGQLNHAVLDVFSQEPLPKDHVFWSHPQITVLPHISAPTNKTTASKIAMENIMVFLSKGTMPTAVNRQQGY